MALSVGTTKSHREDDCPLHLSEFKGQSESIPLHPPPPANFQASRRHGEERVEWGQGAERSLPPPRGVFSLRLESHLSVKGLTYPTHQHTWGSRDSRPEKRIDWEVHEA